MYRPQSYWVETLTQKGIDTFIWLFWANNFFSKIAPFTAFVHNFNKQVIFREIINSHVKSFHDRFNNPYPKDFDPSSSSESVHKYLTFYRKQEIFWQPKHSIIHKERQGVVSLDPRSWWSKDSKGFGWEETTPSSRMRHQEEDQFRDFFSRCCHFSLAAWFCTPPIWRRELADNGWRCTFWHAPSSAGFLNLYNKMVVILNYKLTNKKHTILQF